MKGSRNIIYLLQEITSQLLTTTLCISCDESRYFTISNCIFKFNGLALVDSEIIGVQNLN